MDRQGYLVTRDGDFVLDTNGRRIRMNTALPVSIDRTGLITQDGAEEIESESEIYSGFLEMSNISIVSEMVNMIAIQRQYDSNQKVITTFDETLDTAVNQLGRVK